MLSQMVLTRFESFANDENYNSDTNKKKPDEVLGKNTWTLFRSGCGGGGWRRGICRRS